MVHGDHLQRVPVHAPQVVHQAAALARLHHVVGHALSDLHRLQEVGDKQEFGQEVLTLRHGGWVARWLEGGQEEERGGGGGGGGSANCCRWNNVETVERDGFIRYYTEKSDNNCIKWWETLGGESPSSSSET